MNVDLSQLYAGDFIAVELEHPEFTSRRWTRRCLADKSAKR